MHEDDDEDDENCDNYHVGDDNDHGGDDGYNDNDGGDILNEVIASIEPVKTR